MSPLFILHFQGDKLFQPDVAIIANKLKLTFMI